MPLVNLFGPLDALLADQVEFVLLGVVVLNLVTRGLAHRSYVRQAAEGGAEAVRRYPAHVVTNVLLVLASFYYLTLHHHGGIVASTLVLGLFLTDFFEFESRKVEARRDLDLERPKGSLVASSLVLLYVAYQSLFYLLAPYWNAVF